MIVELRTLLPQPGIPYSQRKDLELSSNQQVKIPQGLVKALYVLLYSSSTRLKVLAIDMFLPDDRVLAFNDA